MIVASFAERPDLAERTGEVADVMVRIVSRFEDADFGPSSMAFGPKSSEKEMKDMHAQTRELMHALMEFEAEHSGESPTDVQQLRPYVRDPAALEGVTLQPLAGL